MMKDMEDSFLTARQEIIIESNGKNLKFYANEIGYLSSLNMSVQSSKHGKNGLALMVAESITDENGNHFTYDEVMRLKKEFSQPFFDAVVEVNKYVSDEKKS